MSAILDHTNGVVATFMRGSDLSGSIQGAGGVGLPRHSEATAGGVLAVNFGPSTLNLQPSTPSQPSTHMVSYDGNGNVVALHNAADGVESAAYEYGPFSEPIRVTGPVASLMPLRFSTMYEDNVTGDRKYLFRDYTPTTGRWKSRDLVGEEGGRNLFGFLNNNSLNKYDFLGLLCSIGGGGGGGGEDKCGVDVTAALERTLREIDMKYSALDIDQKWNSCFELYNVSKRDEEVPWSLHTTKAANAWDIEELARVGRFHGIVNEESRPPFFCGTGKCARTVTVNGGCYRGGSVNFSMWGKANQVCSRTFTGHLGNLLGLPLWSLRTASNAAWVWKLLAYKGGSRGIEELQALTFTIYGYTGILAPVTVPGCSKNQDTSPPSLSWHWNPYLEVKSSK
jgi:RHS repeat-associated protein